MKVRSGGMKRFKQDQLLFVLVLGGCILVVICARHFLGF